MIHVENRCVTLDGDQGILVAEAGVVIDNLAEALAKDLGAGYEIALQIIIESIYRGCLKSHDIEKGKSR